MAWARARRLVELASMSSILWSCGGRAGLEGGASERAVGGAVTDSSMSARGGQGGRGTDDAATNRQGGIGGRTGIGSALSSSAGATTTTGSGGSSNAVTSTGPCGPLIDDMEGAPGRICQDGKRRGAWYSYNDETPEGTQWPERTKVAGVPIPVSDSDRVFGGHSMRTFGNGFDQWGAGIGFDLAFDGKEYGTFDAADYDGVRFWSKGSDFAFRVGVQATTLPRYGGNCAEEPCPILPHQSEISGSETWRLNEVLFSSLRCPSNMTTTLTRDTLTNVQFQARAGGDFDFRIDDVSFFVRPECCLGPMPKCEFIPFTDPALELTIRNHAGRGNRKARCRDACDLTALRVENVTALAGLECLSQLRTLAVSGTFTDLSPLSSLTSLASLEISSTNLTQLAPLRGLRQVGQLSIRSTATSNLAPLSELVNLTSLELPHNRITSTGSLASLTGLVSLNLADNPIENLNAVAQLPNLRSLTVGLKDVPEFRFPKGFPSLETLQITGGYVTRIVLPEEAPNLRTVSITGDEVREVIVPSSLTRLWNLNVEKVLLGRLTFTGAIASLEQLSVTNNQLNVLTLPEGMTGLRQLSLEGNPLSTLTLGADMGTRGSSGLDINVSNSNLSSLAAFEHLDALQVLILMNGKISDLAPLVEVSSPKLNFVNLDGNPIDCAKQAGVLTALKNRGVNVLSRCTN
ncbi:MAG: hypothetical protein QM784_04730 [Polyangiaceae bacterium]